MELGKDMEMEIFNQAHINRVLMEIESTFPVYFDSFRSQQISLLFIQAIMDYEAEQQAYKDYMNVKGLDEFEDDPTSFKRETKTKCPIIRRCLNSKDDMMKQYKIAFNERTGRQMLDGVKKIAQFGDDYAATFDKIGHELITDYRELNLAILNEPEYGVRGVVGYGIQSALLYWQYPHAFAHRSQNAVWSLYFITNRKSFGLVDDSEFLMVQPKKSTCEQNYFYPADLFGFYALKLYIMLKKACRADGVKFEDKYRYIYLSTFTDYVANLHRDDIAVLKWSSDHVESYWH